MSEVQGHTAKMLPTYRWLTSAWSTDHNFDHDNPGPFQLALRASNQQNDSELI